MELKSTLRVFNEANLPAREGIYKGMMGKTLAGSTENPSERMEFRLVSFEPGTHAKMHWHLVEKLYYVISGRAVVTDIEGKTYDLGPGSVAYAPPGIVGAHSWEVKEAMQIISFRASIDIEPNIQFEVNLSNKQSSMTFDYLVRAQATTFKKSLY